MPARLIINTKSTVGYNNKLKQAAPGMKLGVNNDVNPGTKKAALERMKGGNQKSTRPTATPQTRSTKKPQQHGTRNHQSANV